MIPASSNMTLEEIIRYTDIRPEQFNDILQGLQDKIHSLEKEVAYQNGLEDRLREQIGFAQNVIEHIVSNVKCARSVGQAREGVRRAIDDGMFEM